METTLPVHLRWQCRRGMLELDVLLGHFLTEAYLSLSVQDQDTFVRLLACNDQSLFNWFTGIEQADDEILAAMVAKILTHAKNRH